MRKKPIQRNSLRTRAEAKLAGALPSREQTRTDEELRHELEVHQIELEMQNEALRQVQVTLEESRDRYVDLYDFAPIGYLTLTREALVAEVNLTGAALLGVERKQLRRRRFAHFVAAEDRDRWDGFFVNMLQHDERQSCEVLLKRDDGSAFHAQLDCLRLETDGVSVVRIAFTDISERKRAEAELREKEQLLSESQRIAHIGGWAYHPAGGISWTDETYRIYGVSPDTFTPTTETLLGLIHPDDRPAMRAWIEDVQAGKKPGTLEFRINLPGGTVRFLSGRGEWKYDVGNKPSHITGTVQDITAQKQVEQALKESEEKYRSIYEDAQVGLYRTRLSDGKLIMANNAMAKMFGFDSAEEATAKYVTSEHYADPGTREILLDKIQKYGRFDNFEARLTRNDGAIRWFRYSGRLIQNKDYIEGVATDITAHKQAEQNLRDSLLEKDVLMREIHHRVKNNLQMMSAMLELQSSYIKDEQAHGFFMDSQQRIQSMAMIHEQLYHNTNIAQIDFAAFLHSLINNLRMQFKESCSRLNIQVNAKACIFPVDVAIPCGIAANELVSNVFKHAFPDGRAGELRITLQCSNDGKIVLEVADNGVGMPAGFDIHRSESFGMRLLTLMFEKQLHGKLIVESNHGTRIVCETGEAK